MSHITRVVDPHFKHPTTLMSLLTTLSVNRRLVLHMVKRAIVERYRGSVLGVAWSFFTPLLLLLVYTFVFAFVFKARWGDAATEENKFQFAIVLFVGIIIHGLFAEVLNSAPNLIVGNTNYVKKVVFPLEILPCITLGVALFQSCVSVIVLLVACFFLNEGLYPTALFFPIVVFPLVIMTLGIAWLLSSLGVFLRDVGQMIGLLTMVMLFLAPVFYPVSALPEKYQFWIMLNPLTFIIEQSREVLIWGKSPNWKGMGLYSLISLLIAWMGYAWFQKTRKGFADVI